MPRVFFYVQHLLGVGHLARASRIAATLKDDGWQVTMALGGVPVAGFPVAGPETVKLPAVRAGESGFTELVDLEGHPIDEAFRGRRRDMLLGAFEASQADVLIVEAFPFGRRQMRFELLPLLGAASARRPRPLIATSIRDILQESRKPGRAEECTDTIARFFDLVLVHGDPQFATLDQTFPLASRFAGKIAYTGLVAAPPAAPSNEKFDVIVSAGGGAAGARLLLAAAEAMIVNRSTPRNWCFITGPNIAPGVATKLSARLAGKAAVFEFRPDFPSLLRSAALSISQAGYNTVCDLLRAQCRMLLVPFAKDGETEQTMRAIRLRDRGLAQVASEAELSVEHLSESIAKALAMPLSSHHLNLEGAAETARILRQRLNRQGAGLAGPTANI